jgi:iron(III) transport system substrate-binding protein
MSVRLIRLSSAVGAFGLAVSLAACGSSPTDSEGGDASGGSGGSLDEVYQEVDGLEGEERMDRLVELAEENGGKVGWYYVGDMTALIDGFEEATGLSVVDYQTVSEDLAERAGQEFQTDQQGSDLLLGAAVDLETLDGDGVLGTLETPAVEDVDESYTGPNAIAPYANLFATAYNTDLIEPGQEPSSYEELFDGSYGRLGIETGDWYWYQAVVRQYFMDKKGMTEQEAIDLITDGLASASQVEGHSLLAELLASGEYAATPHTFTHSVVPLVEADAPIDFVENSDDIPPVALTNTMGITEGGPNPAGGLALLEWLMSSDGQQIFADLNYLTTSNSFTGESIRDDFPTPLVVDTGNAEDQQEWQAKYDELLQTIGGKTIAE